VAVYQLTFARIELTEPIVNVDQVIHFIDVNDEIAVWRENFLKTVDALPNYLHFASRGKIKLI